MYVHFCIHIYLQMITKFCLYFNSGMLHAGIGETQLNNLLSTMNLHCIDHKSLKAREHEVGIQRNQNKSVYLKKQLSV